MTRTLTEGEQYAYRLGFEEAKRAMGGKKRIEVHDECGRSYVRNDVHVDFDMSDNGAVIVVTVAPLDHEAYAPFKRRARR